MLKDISHEEYLMRFNKFPKTKYTIYLNCTIFYEFTTTSRSEEECIEIMKKMISPLVYVNKKSYSAYAVSEGNKKLLFRGRTKCYYDN